MVDNSKWDSLDCEDSSVETSLREARELRAQASELLSNCHYI
jgi:hypothetical protein